MLLLFVDYESCRLLFFFINVSSLCYVSQKHQEFHFFPASVVSSLMPVKTKLSGLKTWHLCLFTGDQPGADLGPLISPQAKERVCHLIEKGVQEGASLLLDGRNVKVKGYENGNFVGPTILAKVKVR